MTTANVNSAVLSEQLHMCLLNCFVGWQVVLSHNSSSYGDRWVTIVNGLYLDCLS